MHLLNHQYSFSRYFPPPPPPRLYIHPQWQLQCGHDRRVQIRCDEGWLALPDSAAAAQGSVTKFKLFPGWLGSSTTPYQ